MAERAVGLCRNGLRYSRASHTTRALVVTALVWPGGGYPAGLFAGGRAVLDSVMRPVERASYRLAGVNPRCETALDASALAFVLLRLAGACMLDALPPLQQSLPTLDATSRARPMPSARAMNLAVGSAATTTGMFGGGVAGLAVGILVWQGVPVDWNPSTIATTLEGDRQTIAQGPVAAQELTEHPGTHGSSSFNVNAAHPF